MLLYPFIHVAQAIGLFLVAPLLLAFCLLALARGRLRRAVAWGSGCAIALGLYLGAGFESYCYLYPAIDTRYAPGFSERRFAQVQAGMSMDDVVTLLGEPLHKGLGRGAARWAYTQDGRCVWADWAWLGREVVFRDGRVVERISRIYYD